MIKNVNGNKPVGKKPVGQKHGGFKSESGSGNDSSGTFSGYGTENKMSLGEGRMNHGSDRPNITGMGVLASAALHSRESTAVGRKKRPTANAKNAAVPFESETDPLGSWTGVPTDSEIPTQDADDL